MMRSTIQDNRKHKTIRIWAIVVWLIIWEIASRIIDQGILLVSPVLAVRRVWELAQSVSFITTILHSMLQIVLGFLSATIIGCILAVISNMCRWIEELLQPMFSVMKATPVASFIILCLVFLSSQRLSVFCVFIMVLPIAYTNVIEGIQSVDKKLLEMAQVFQVPTSRKIRYIYVPAIWPFFYSACKVGIGFSFKSGIAAEVIGIPTGTIGERLYQAKIYLDTQDLFAWTIVIIVVGRLFEKVFLFLIRKGYKRFVRRKSI